MAAALITSPNAGDFKLERWEACRSGWKYLPFDGGPRICIGQQFALTEAGYVLVRMLQRFDGLEDVDADQRIRWGLALVSAPGDTVTVRLHEASR
ncbi:Cytochrome P450 E-class [Penicillium sp. IBT 35674x]|nr:Cytochrome P450 E-class [Penicillium sp. IBT 35674x]